MQRAVEPFPEPSRLSCNETLPPPGLHAVHPVVHLLHRVQREQQTGAATGAPAVDVRRDEPARGVRLRARFVVLESRTVAENKPAGASTSTSTSTSLLSLLVKILARVFRRGSERCNVSGVKKAVPTFATCV